MMYQKNNYNRRTTYRSGGIDWKRTIVHCAIFIIILSAIQMIFTSIGLGGHGILFLCLAIIIWYFGPRIWRNIKLSHRDKQSRNRKKVNRYEILDLED